MLHDILGSRKRSFAGVLSLAMVLLVLVFGCTAAPAADGSKSRKGGGIESFVVYAASDGLYRSGLTAGSSEKIFDGEKLSRPILSEDGDMIMFRQDDTQRQDTSDPGRISVYVYHFGLKQTILLKESSYSYCAGPDDTFVMTTADGRLLQAKFQTAQKDGAETLECRTEDISVWPEAVEKDPQVSIQYENVKSSPDFHYLAYDVRVEDNRTDNRPEGFGPYYSGGLYVLDCKTVEAVMVVEPVRSTEVSIGNDPVPGPWSPDGKTLWVWDKPQSASLSADGVTGFFYHADTGLKTDYGIPALSYTGNRKEALDYDENISFSGVGTAAVLSGGGREMFDNKEIDLITDYSGAAAGSQEIKSITENGLVPAMPQLSADGKTLYFAALSKEDFKGYKEGNWTTEEYQNIWPLKRQIYSATLEDDGKIKAGKITRLTSDPSYRNENPVLLKDNCRLVFGRASANAYDGKMGIWVKDLPGGREIKLAEWQEPAAEDTWMAEKYQDFYGRGSWSGIFAIYDAAK